MSRFEIERVTCPACDHQQDVEIYVSINAERMREATDQLIDGSWELLVCVACSHNFRIDNRLLYTDLPRRQWIVQHSWADRARYQALEEEAARVFRTEYLEHPPQEVRRQARGIEPRVCFGRPQLAEKLSAWRHGIDDCVLECLKLVVLRNHLNELFPLGPSELQLAAVEPERLNFVVVALGSGHALKRLAVARGELTRIADDLDSFRPTFPDLFDRPFVNASRYLL